MSLTVRRKARKGRRCDGCDRGGKIQPGDVYLSHVYFPSDDCGPDGRPARYTECAGCATRSGRGPLLEVAAKP